MIKVKDLVKDYGKVRALDRINFEINQGEIVGFLGPNGAGKSTTLKILTCYLKQTEGNIFVNDLNVTDDEDEIKKLIGYLPEQNPLYQEMLVYDYLKFIYDIREIKEDFDPLLRRIVEKCGLAGHLEKAIGTLSKGYKQRVGLAQAIIHDPEILILDEPTSGLDPNQILEIRALIKELGKEKTVIFSSHILQEVQSVCDRIIIINKGKIIKDATKENLLSVMGADNHLQISVQGSKDRIIEMEKALSGIKITQIEGSEENTYSFKVICKNKTDRRSEISDYIMKNELKLLELKTVALTLEEVFHLSTKEDK